VIERCRDQYPVRMMCRCLRVSTSGYYDWHGRKPSQRARDNARLLQRIEEIHEASDGVRGSPNITEKLNYEGLSCSQNRVARIMQAHDIRGIPQKKRWKKKASAARPVGVQNLLDRDFRADRPNEKWVTDITYIRSGEGWLYLCIVLDLSTDEVVGWSMSPCQTTDLVLRAVMMAIRQRTDHGPTILHSDRGTQFTSVIYQDYLAEHGLVSSMSAVGSCADNAAAEGFFGRLKRERVNRRRYITRREVQTDVFDYIERVHNAERRSAACRSALSKPSERSG